jgi:TolB-like protein/cytochrome c-type biogenesis protein CcmH/NrfG
VHGDGVNIAARIEPLAEPGGVCCSEDVARQIQNKIDLPVQRIGKADLKNIRMPIEIYRLVLPWEPTHSQRLTFSLAQKGGRRIAIGLAALLILGLATTAGLNLWQKPQQQQPPTSPAKHRIAVLPFANISADPQAEYFADGMTEELISHLSRISSLGVIGRTSVMTYKGKDKKLADIGRELNVGTILEGSVRKIGDKVRITAQLIDMPSEEHLWSQDYDRELRDVFAIQNDIAKRVTDALQVQLGAGEKQLLDRKGTENLDAYNAYLKGLYHMNKYTEEGFKTAIKHFGEAVEKDPGYAQAYAMTAFSYDNLGFFGFLPQKVAFSKGRAAITKALELDDTRPEAYAELGNIKVYDYDWSGAEQAFKRAVELGPNSAVAHYWYGISYLSPMERHNEAIAAIRRALELDPLSLQINGDLVCAFHHAGRYPEALAQSRKVLEMDPNHFVALWCQGQTYMAEKKYAEAIASFQKMEAATSGWSGAKAMLGWAYAAAGQKDKAKGLLAELGKKAKHEEVPPIFFVAVLGALDEKDEAFRWLERAYEERSGYLVYLKVDSWYDSVRADPRFSALLRRMRLDSLS